MRSCVSGGRYSITVLTWRVNQEVLMQFVLPLSFIDLTTFHRQFYRIDVNAVRIFTISGVDVILQCELSVRPTLVSHYCFFGNKLSIVAMNRCKR